MTEIALTSLPSKYSSMLELIDKKLPLAISGAEAFHKSSSQFKSVTLDVVDLTPVSSAKHLLAVITHTRQAIEEASISVRRKRLNLKNKESQLISATGAESEELLIDIDELNFQIESIEDSIKGAVRKLSAAINQYEAILHRLGKSTISESDYEDDQVRYHIMTAFNQALCAARSRGGLIDEGNHIYLMQLGINGAVAQAEVSALLESESELLANGKAPSHDMIILWLEALAEKYSDAPREYIKRRGLIQKDESTILEVTGNDRHLPIER